MFNQQVLTPAVLDGRGATHSVASQERKVAAAAIHYPDRLHPTISFYPGWVLTPPTRVHDGTYIHRLHVRPCITELPTSTCSLIPC